MDKVEPTQVAPRPTQRDEPPYPFLAAMLRIDDAPESAEECITISEKGSYWQLVTDKAAAPPGHRAEIERIFEYVDTWDRQCSLWKWRDSEWAKPQVFWIRPRSALVDAPVPA